MSLTLDIKNFGDLKETNFGCQLFRLMQKADHRNSYRLFTAFPNAAAVYIAWLNNDVIPDLPYD